MKSLRITGSGTGRQEPPSALAPVRPHPEKTQQAGCAEECLVEPDEDEQDPLDDVLDFLNQWLSAEPHLVGQRHP